MNVAGIDKFLSDVYTKKIKKNLDKKELRKIERELFLKNGMSIKIAMEDFDKFDLHLKNNIINYRNFELNCINEICQINNSKNQSIVKLLDKQLKNEILRYFGDEEIRTILLKIMKKELTIPDILKQSKLPKTTGYRKIENLIKKGVIIETGSALSKRKIILKYRCIFEKIDIQLKDNSFLIIGYISKKDFEKSTIMTRLGKC